MIRTLDLQLRRLTLYPSELWARMRESGFYGAQHDAATADFNHDDARHSVTSRPTPTMIRMTGQKKLRGFAGFPAFSAAVDAVSVSGNAGKTAVSVDAAGDVVSAGDVTVGEVTAGGGATGFAVGDVV